MEREILNQDRGFRKDIAMRSKGNSKGKIDKMSEYGEIYLCFIDCCKDLDK